MPTEITRPSAPITRRIGTPGPGSCDVTPLSITALAIIAILVLILHVAGGDLLRHSQANASVAAPDDAAKGPADATPSMPSLPFD
jgi:hypothetical protein